MTQPPYITTTRDLITTVAERWRAQYPVGKEISAGHTGRILERLRQLDLATATENDLADIIGNTTWTRHRCDCCGSDVDWTVTVGEEPDYESRTVSMCRKCFDALVAFVNNEVRS